MTCSPDLVPKCHIPWGQALKLKHCCPNNLSPPYFSLLNCRHLLEFCHSAIWYDWCRSYKEGIFSEAKTISKLPQIVAWEHYKTSSTKCSISQNKLTKKIDKYILHKIDTGWWLCCLSLTLVGQPLGGHHVPTQRSDNWRQRLHLCFQMGLMSGNLFGKQIYWFLYLVVCIN